MPRHILQRLALEPAAIGTTLASVLPALVVLDLVSLDERSIGVLVVAINALVGLAVRLLVMPTSRPSPDPAQPDLAHG
jgi:hypothetical protein